MLAPSKEFEQARFMQIHNVLKFFSECFSPWFKPVFELGLKLALGYNTRSYLILTQTQAPGIGSMLRRLLFSHLSVAVIAGACCTTRLSHCDVVLPFPHTALDHASVWCPAPV